MKLDAANTIALAGILMTLAANLIVLTRGFTRLEEGQKATREDLAEHTEREEKRFDSVGQQLHRQAGRLQTLETRQAVTDEKLKAHGAGA